MELEKVCAWLRAYPELEGLQLDRVGAEPGCCGLFPGGVEQVKRRENLLGGVTVSCRQTFTLRRRAARDAQAATWLVGFESWVARQSAFGAAPVLGDGQCAWKAEKGTLTSGTQTGTGMYTVTLRADYIKIYEETE